MPRSVSVQRHFAPAPPVRRTAARRAEAVPARRAAAPASILPRVSIHLPICDESPAMVRRTLDAIARLDHPDFEVLVIDSNTVDPALWEPVAEHCARLGARFRFFHLGAWPGGKAGALNFALRETAPDAAVIAALDCGTVVQPDWLRRMLAYFADPTIGFAWSPQVDSAASPWAAETPLRANAEVIPTHAMTLVRRAAIEPAGGWAEGTLAEDTDLGLRLLRRGWHAACCPESFGGAFRPQDFAAASRRRFRHAYGAMQICRTHSRVLLSPFEPALTLHQRGTLIAAWLPDLADALCLLLLLAALAWSAGLILNPRLVRFPALPLMLVPVLLCTLTAVRAVHRCPGRTGWHSCAGAAVAGLALSHASGSGVWQAVLGGHPDMVEGAPRHSRRAPARAELVLLLLSWGAIAGIAVTRNMGQPGAVAWCVMLLIQSLPCLAAAVAALHADPVREAGGISRVPHGVVPL